MFTIMMLLKADEKKSVIGKNTRFMLEKVINVTVLPRT